MLFALWMACAGTEVQEDRDELLDRLEALEREVVALRGAKRGTKRGDVLFDLACEGEGVTVTFPAWFKDMPLVPPRWEVWTNDEADGSAEWVRLPSWIVGAEEDFCTGGDRRWVAIAW